jgi:hypothetical protein
MKTKKAEDLPVIVQILITGIAMKRGCAKDLTQQSAAFAGVRFLTSGTAWVRASEKHRI